MAHAPPFTFTSPAIFASWLLLPINLCYDFYRTKRRRVFMAKDGTNRGGRRVRAGAKPVPLNEKLAAGRPATRLAAPSEFDVFDLDDLVYREKTGLMT